MFAVDLGVNEMHMSWEFEYRGQRVVIDRQLDTMYFIQVNGYKTHRGLTLEEVCSWMANSMMNCKCK